jgi:hypothetical protein
MNLLGPEEKCYRLKVLNTWSPAGGTVLGDRGNFGKWGLAGRSRSLEEGL